MKKLLLLLVVLSFAFLQCGEDGEDGLAFLAFDWDTLPDWYFDNNDSVPAVIVWLEDYETEPDTYDFSYGITESEIYYEWEGTYIIKINKGKDGGLFSSGKDGKDIYYTLFLGAVDGPEIYRPATAGPDVKSLKKTAPEMRLEKQAIGETRVQELSKGNTIFRLEYRLKGKSAVQ